jgi:hypothetical protein
MSLLPAGDGDRFGYEAVLVIELDRLCLSLSLCLSLYIYVYHDTTRRPNRRIISDDHNQITNRKAILSLPRPHPTIGQFP